MSISRRSVRRRLGTTCNPEKDGMVRTNLIVAALMLAAPPLAAAQAPATPATKAVGRRVPVNCMRMYYDV